MVAVVKHEVFLSSTYADLIEARRKVISAILQSGCFVSSMEYFPATSEEQVEFLHHIIDECDFYLLIVGGAYGSLHSSGVSFTEREFDYAVSKNKPVIAFLHRDPDTLPESAREADAVRRRLFEAFCEKVKANRIVGLWTNEDDLAAQVVLSLARQRRIHAGGGWVRSDQAVNSETVQQVAKLAKDLEQSREERDAIAKHLISLLEIDPSIYDQSIVVEHKSNTSRKAISIGEIAFACAGTVFEPQSAEVVTAKISEIAGILVGFGYIDMKSAKAVLGTLISIGLLKGQDGRLVVDQQEMARLRLWRSGQAGRKNLSAALEQVQKLPFWTRLLGK